MSTFRHLKVVTKSQIGQADVEMDGESQTGTLKAITLRVEAGEVNKATLELRAPTFEVDGEFEVLLSEDDQVLLKHLGWTPPEEGL